MAELTNSDFLFDAFAKMTKPTNALKHYHDGALVGLLILLFRIPNYQSTFYF